MVKRDFAQIGLREITPVLGIALAFDGNVSEKPTRGQASAFLQASLSKMPRSNLSLPQHPAPRHFRSRLTTIRPLGFARSVVIGLPLSMLVGDALTSSLDGLKPLDADLSSGCFGRDNVGTDGECSACRARREC